MNNGTKAINQVYTTMKEKRLFKYFIALNCDVL